VNGKNAVRRSIIGNPEEGIIVASLNTPMNRKNENL
jgi:hypothetical protein